MERDRTQLLVLTMKELNTQYNLYNKRASNTPPLAVNRVKVIFKDEPGEGSGVTRSFYTAIAEVCNDPILHCDPKGCRAFRRSEANREINNN